MTYNDIFETLTKLEKGDIDMKGGIKKLIKNLLIRVGIFIMRVPVSGIYAESGMATIHNKGCLEESKFQAAYKRAIKAADIDYGIQWKIYIVCWAALQATRAGKGDFVECGVNRGFISSAIMTYLDWNKLDRVFYLVDTFSGIHEDILSDEEDVFVPFHLFKKRLIDCL